MKFSIIIILFLIFAAGCSKNKSSDKSSDKSLDKTFDEAKTKFYANEISFKRLEQLFRQYKFDFQVVFDDFQIKQNNQFTVLYLDSVSKTYVPSYLQLNFNSSDSSYQKVNEHLKVKYEVLKELTELLIKIDCRSAMFFKNSFFMENIVYYKDGFSDGENSKRIEGNWYVFKNVKP